MQIVKYEDGKLIEANTNPFVLIVEAISQFWIYPTDSMGMTGPLTDPGAIVKFSHFRSNSGTRMLWWQFSLLLSKKYMNK